MKCQLYFFPFGKKIEFTFTSGPTGFLGFQSLILMPGFLPYQGFAAAICSTQKVVSPYPSPPQKGSPTPPDAANSTVPVIFLLFTLPLIYLCMCLLPDFLTGEKLHEIKGHRIYLLLAPQCLQLFLALCLHYKYLLNA